VENIEMNLENMSVDQLQQLQDQINREIKQRRARDKKEILTKIKAMAAAGGYTLEELVSAANAIEPMKTVRSVPPKYRHPLQSDLTWTGRGKKPHWVTECIAGGKTLADLTIR
jgi:DNA-binding protein H-NS